MKQKWCAALLAVLMLGSLLTGCGEKSGGAVKVRLNEVTHSVFYAPQYAAMELGFFADEGLDIELTNGTYRDIEDRIQDGRLDCGFLSAIENDPLDFTPLFDDPMLVITAHDHSLTKKSSLPLRELKKHPLISQFQGSDHDVQQIFKKAKIHPQTKYILDDDISVMGMVSQGEGIALMPELMLQTASFDLSCIPLDPPQHRTIGIAALPVRETPLLIRTFIAFCRSFSF